MALDLGELNATISIDDSEFDEGLDQAEGRFSKWGDKLQVAAAAAGVVIAGALTAALADAMEVDNAQAKLAAQLGDEQWAKELGKVAGHMYTEGWGESVADNMETIRAIMSSGLLAEDATSAEIEAISTKAKALADVFDQDVLATARAAGQMIRNGLAKDAAEAFDILTRGMQQTGDMAGDMMDTWSEYSTQFRKLGLTGVQAMGLMTQGLRAGARDIDTVADGLKEFAIRAADGSKASAEGFKAIGLDAEKMTKIFAKGGPDAAAALDLVLDKLRAIKDPVAREAAAIALFGTKAEDMQKALFAMDLTTATNQMGQVAGAADKMANAVGASAGAQLDSFKRKVQMALVEQLAKAVPYLTATGVWMNKHAAIVGPLVGALGGLAAIIGVIIVVTKIWAAVQMALNVAMALNPIGLLIAGIVLLVAGIALLWFKCEGFRNAITAMWEALVFGLKLYWAAVQVVWGAIADFFVGWWHLFTGTWKKVFEALGALIGWVIDRWNGLIEFITSLPGRITAAAKNMWDGIVNSAKGAVNAVIRAWNALDISVSVRVPDWVPVYGGRTFGVPDLIPDIPYLDVGGRITKTGLAVVHKDEQVLTAAEVRRRRGDDDPAAGGQVTGTIWIRGTGLLAGLREEVAIRGGNVQAVLGS